MSAEERVRRALAALAEVDASRRAPPALERAVLDAFDRRQRRGFFLRTLSPFRTYRYEVLGMATAAVIALAVYLQSPSPRMSPESPGVLDLVSAAVTPVIDANKPDLPSPPPAVVPALPATRTRRVQSSVGRVAPTWTEISDVVHAVHVQVPRTMLPLLGIPIIDPDAPGTVNVEFLLGNDGLARTIRIHP